MAAQAATARRAGTRAPALKFPCGHVQSAQAVGRRTRTTARAAWVPCRRCNLIALVVAPA
ncbi:MAG TPA: hypothetical protein VMR23_09405 [Candidatus Limnocylindria bacterium]|nr:hypothetical protein [Candidatus Limnocylindria bacterium]